MLLGLAACLPPPGRHLTLADVLLRIAVAFLAVTLALDIAGLPSVPLAIAALAFLALSALVP